MKLLVRREVNDRNYPKLTRRFEGLVAPDALLEMLGDIVHRIGMQKSVVNRCPHRGWKRIGTIRADLFRREEGLTDVRFCEAARMRVTLPR